MCPSVWLTLDVLAGKQKNQCPNEKQPAMAQFIDNWLDKLKANRCGNNSVDDFGSPNVQFALDLNDGGVEVQSGPENSLDKNGSENGKKKKRKKGKGVKKAAKDNFCKEDLMEELKPLVDCRYVPIIFHKVFLIY